MVLLHTGNTGWKRIPGNKTVVTGEICQDYLHSVQSLAVCAGCQLFFGSPSAQGLFCSVGVPVLEYVPVLDVKQTCDK